MKSIILACLIVGCAAGTAKAETVVLVADNHNEMAFLRHYDAKIKALENYTVTFDDGSTVNGQKKVRRAPQKEDNLKVQLVRR